MTVRFMLVPVLVYPSTLHLDIRLFIYRFLNEVNREYEVVPDSTLQPCKYMPRIKKFNSQFINLK
jgi:hypothetical protein